MGQRLARFNDYKETRLIYYADHLGSMRALTNEDGDIIAQVDYKPYGQQLNVTGSPEAATYTGKEYDDEWDFDLYYYGARYMDPALGRFISPDPINDFLNPYSYVGNNPVNRIDPTGMVGLPKIKLPGIHFVYGVVRIPMWFVLSNILGEMSVGLSPSDKYDKLREIENNRKTRLKNVKVHTADERERELTEKFLNLNDPLHQIQVDVGGVLEDYEKMGLVPNPDIDNGLILLLSPEILKGSADSYDNSAWGPEIFDEINDEYSDIFRGLLEHEMEHALDYEDGYNIFGTRHIQIMTELKASDAQYNYFRNNQVDEHRHPEIYNDTNTYWNNSVNGFKMMRDTMQWYNSQKHWGYDDDDIGGLIDLFLDWH